MKSVGSYVDCSNMSMTGLDTCLVSNIVILGSFQKLKKKNFQNIYRIACEEIFDVGVNC